MAAFAKNVMLAETWDEKTTDPKGWWISEKLDGVRTASSMINLAHTLYSVFLFHFATFLLTVYIV
jgi:ATP-dependent DNA ligase